MNDFGNRFLGRTADILCVETVSAIVHCRFAFYYKGSTSSTVKG